MTHKNKYESRNVVILDNNPSYYHVLEELVVKINIAHKIKLTKARITSQTCQIICKIKNDQIPLGIDMETYYQEYHLHQVYR